MTGVYNFCFPVLCSLIMASGDVHLPVLAALMWSASINLCHTCTLPVHVSVLSCYRIFTPTGNTPYIISQAEASQVMGFCCSILLAWIRFIMGAVLLSSNLHVLQDGYFILTLSFSIIQPQAADSNITHHFLFASPEETFS